MTNINENAATVWNRGQDRDQRAPKWPLDSSRSNSEAAQGVVLQAHSAHFFESGSDLYLALNTDPVTLWKIDRSFTPASGSSESPMLYVGAICAFGSQRLRVAVAAGDHLYFTGDRGTWAIPICAGVSSGGCCVLPDDFVPPVIGDPPGPVIIDIDDHDGLADDRPLLPFPEFPRRGR